MTGGVGEAETVETAEEAENTSITEWAYGFKPGETPRNILVGVLYFITWPVSIWLLMYANWKRNSSHKTDEGESKKSGIDWIPGMGKQHSTRRNVLVGSGYAFVVGLVAVEEWTRPNRGEQVVDIWAYERRTEHFEVEKGQTIWIGVENEGTGFNTHIVLENPEEEVVLSEGVEDSAAWEFKDAMEGRWTVRHTPWDDSSQTGGSVEVYVRGPD